MKTFNLSCSFPSHPVHAFLFTEVNNAAQLKIRLLAGDPEYVYAFLNAELIVSQLQILAAVNRAIHDEHYGLMRTKNLHSEIVYAVSGTQNIGDAFRTFGLNDSTKHIVVLKVSSADASEVSEHVKKIVVGKELEFNDDNIAALTKIAKVWKYYKLDVPNDENAPKSLLGLSPLED